MTTTVPTELLALDRECYPSNPLTPSQWRKVMALPNSLILTNGKAYAVGMVVSEGGSECLKLRRFGVAVEERGKGEGKRLLEVLRERAVEVELREDNLPGLKLLTGQGFQVLGLQRGQFGVDGVTLWRAGK